MTTNKNGGGFILPSESNEIEILLTQIKREIEVLTNSTEAKFLLHDAKINEIALYVKNNLSNTLRTLIDSMKLSGELDEIITESISTQLRSLMLKSRDITDYGADGNGYNDSSLAITKMLNDLGYAIIPAGEFTLRSTIKLKTGQYIFGNGIKSTLKVDSSIKGDVFQLTKYNEVKDLRILQEDSNWEGNYFTISSETLESENLTAYENLSIKIHDLVLNTKGGTFIHYFATNKDQDDIVYKTYGLWNLKVYNINHYGQLHFIQRCYTYNNGGKNAWITQNVWENCVFNSVYYGWFGNVSEKGFECVFYKSPHFKINNCTVQALPYSKNLFYFTGEVDAEIINTLPYDWSTENPDYKIIKIHNRNLNGYLNICNNSFTDNYINWIEFTKPVEENIYTYLGEFLKVNGIWFSYLEKPIYLDMSSSTPKNGMLYKITHLENSSKRNLAFQLFFRASMRHINFSLEVDSSGNCTIRHDKLPFLLQNTKFYKNGNDIYMSFPNQIVYAYLRQLRYPQEDFNNFLDLHIQKIGDITLTDDYKTINMSEFA